VKFVVDEVTLGQVFLPTLGFSPVYITPSVMLTHLHLHLAVTGGTNGRSPGTFQKAVLFRKSGKVGYKSTFTFFKNTLELT
jgi:hypothetical protein